MTTKVSFIGTEAGGYLPSVHELTLGGWYTRPALVFWLEVLGFRVDRVVSVVEAEN